MRPKVIVACILLLLSVQTVMAEGMLPGPGVTPDSPFYSLDRLAERFSLFFSFSASEKAQKKAMMAAERLAEIEVMVERGQQQYLPGLSEEYLESISEAEAAAGERAVSLKDRTKVFVVINETFAKHRFLLIAYEGRLPDAVVEAFEAAEKKRFNGKDKSAKEKRREEIKKKTDAVIEEGDKKLEAAKEVSDKVLNPMSDKFAKKVKEKFKGKDTEEKDD